MTEPERVRIHYLRPPDRLDIFVQQLVLRDAECIITFMPRTPLPRPVAVNGQVVLEQDSPVIWFTWPGRMHDIGCFHDAAGRFTGWYANVLTPVHFLGSLEWQTTDLFLDVWLGAGSDTAVLLDEDEFEAAVAAGVLNGKLAGDARAEAERLLVAAGGGAFPPACVRAWSLERVRTLLRNPAPPPV